MTFISYKSPRNGALTPLDIAALTIPVWDAYNPGDPAHPEQGLGFPSGTPDGATYRDAGFTKNKANGFSTPQFAIYMTVLGYWCGLEKYQPYADAAIIALQKATWGCGPNDTPGHGLVQGVDYYRPEHHGGVITVFSKYTTWTDKDGGGHSTERYGHAGKAAAATVIDGFTFEGDNGLPQWLPSPLRRQIQDWADSHQQPEDGNVVPTSVEATCLGFMAMRIYLKYKYNVNWPTAGGTNGLQLLKGRLNGKVQNSSNQPLKDVQVVMVNGNRTVSPFDSSFDAEQGVASAVTDEYGCFSLPVLSTGTYTVYFFKVTTDQYTNWTRKVLTFSDTDTVYAFPSAIQLQTYLR